MAHAWWGGSVTSYGRGTKFLRESLANFSTWHLARERYGRDLFKFYLDNYIFARGRANKPLFNAESDEQKFAYTKGAIVLDILRQEMGDEVFFKTLKEFARRYRNGYATFIDFVSLCNEVSRRDWMPFFYQWCYGKGCPAYHLVGFESKQGKQGWQTKVKIRNDGTGIVRCPLELQMDGQSQQEVFGVQGGQESTFVYQTEEKVTGVVIDPKETAYQANRNKSVRIEQGQMTREEKAAIDEYYRIKAKIEKGERFEETSTPLHALLSLMSACRARDPEGVSRACLSPRSITDSFDNWYSGLSRQDILRAPLPPKDVKDKDIRLIYVRKPEYLDGLIFVFWKGKWMHWGNVGNPAVVLQWRQYESLLKPRILKSLEGQ